MSGNRTFGAALALPVLTLLGLAAPARPEPVTVMVRLSEWKVELSERKIAAGTVTFRLTNTGNVPHQFEVEGQGIEEETALIQPGSTATLSLTLKPGRYEIYCPVGNGSHKHLGMETELEVAESGAMMSGRDNRMMDGKDAEGGKTMDPQMDRMGSEKMDKMGQEAEHRMDMAPEDDGAMMHQEAQAKHDHRQAIRVSGGGPVVQILPGSFPFIDSAAPILQAFGEEHEALESQARNGPYSDNVAPARGTFTFTAWDLGAVRDSVLGTALVRTRDGTRWKVVLDRVQTRDVPHHPKFGGVIMGLYYHGATQVHTPLVPTINSAVALWAVAHLYRNDVLVTDNAMVHVMLLSRTRRPGDWKLACWDCSGNPIEELQLQVTSAPGDKPIGAPGGFLFVNWEKSAFQPLS